MIEAPRVTSVSSDLAFLLWFELDVLCHSSLVFNVLLQAFLSLWAWPESTTQHSLLQLDSVSCKNHFLFPFISYFLKKSIKTVKINLQPLRSEPKFLTLFTQFNVLLHSMSSFQSETLTEISLMLRQSSIFAMTHLCVSWKYCKPDTFHC